jgi:DNA invertase Pin-like site-specific DNA recombinase
MKEAGPPTLVTESRVYGYASVPGSEGSIINRELRGQAEAIASECEDRELRLLQVISEREPAKGKGLRRPGLAYALTRIRQGEACGLVVRELARLTRSAAELGAILEWFVSHEARLIAISEEIDTAERSGQVAVRTLIGFSNSERERITARTRRGLEVARGHRVSGRPAVNDNPYLRARIQQMREQAMSLQAIADTLNAEGVPTVRGGAKWRPSSLQSVTGYRRKEPELASLLSGDAS